MSDQVVMSKVDALFMDLSSEGALTQMVCWV